MTTPLYPEWADLQERASADRERSERDSVRDFDRVQVIASSTPTQGRSGLIAARVRQVRRMRAYGVR